MPEEKKELRKASFLIGEQDPCLICLNRKECGEGGGCLGWAKDPQPEIKVFAAARVLCLNEMGGGSIQSGPNDGERFSIGNMVLTGDTVVCYRGRYACLPYPMQTFVGACIAAIDTIIEKETAGDES